MTHPCPPDTVAADGQSSPSDGQELFSESVIVGASNVSPRRRLLLTCASAVLFPRCGFYLKST